MPCEQQVCEQSDQGQEDTQKWFSTWGKRRKWEELGGKLWSCSHGQADEGTRWVLGSARLAQALCPMSSVCSVCCALCPVLPVPCELPVLCALCAPRALRSVCPVLSPSGGRASVAAPCSAGTYILLLQANSAQNRVQCFPAITGSTAEFQWLHWCHLIKKQHNPLWRHLFYIYSQGWVSRMLFLHIPQQKNEHQQICILVLCTENSSIMRIQLITRSATDICGDWRLTGSQF